MTIDNVSSNYLMTHELQLFLEASRIEWPGFRNHILCIVHVRELALGAFMSSIGVNGWTKSWQAHEHDQQCGEVEGTDIGKSQRLRKEGNARINMMSAMRPGLAKIIEKVGISWYFESRETNLHKAENACCIDYSGTCSWTQVHWLSTSQTLHCCTTYYRCDDTLELDTGVVWASVPIMRIYPRVTPESNLQWIPATLYKAGWMDHCPVPHRSFQAIPILDPVDIAESYGHIAPYYDRLQWHVELYGWCYPSFRLEEDSIWGLLVLHGEVSKTEDVKILSWTDFNDGYVVYFSTHLRSFQPVTIILKVGTWHGYRSWGQNVVYYPIPRGIMHVCREWILC